MASASQADNIFISVVSHQIGVSFSAACSAWQRNSVRHTNTKEGWEYREHHVPKDKLMLFRPRQSVWKRLQHAVNSIKMNTEVHLHGSTTFYEAIVF